MSTQVLIVDDQLSMRKLLTYALEKEFNVCTAENGTQALEMIYKHRPKVVLLDVMMPFLSGHQVLSAVRFDEELAGTKVAFVSGENSPSKVEEGIKEYGADAYFTKPVKIQEIQNWVRSQIST